MRMSKSPSKILLKESSTHFTIVDLNADGIPELILGTKGSDVRDASAYYTYKDGKAVKIKRPLELFPVYGALYSMPSRGTFAFRRGGPGFDDGEGSGGMPYLVREYKLENRKIKLVNEAYWIKYERGIKAGENDYQLNGKKCTEEEFQEIYKSIGSVIELVPNSTKNRKKLGVNGA